MNFSNVVNQKLSDVGKTQDDLAKQIKLSLSYVNQVIQEKNDSPRARYKIKKGLKEFGCNLKGVWDYINVGFN